MLWCHRMTVHFADKNPIQNTTQFLNKNPRQIPLKNPKQIYALITDLSQISTANVSDLSKTCPKPFPDLSQTCPGPIHDLSWTWPRLAQDLSQTCIRPASDLPWTFHTSVLDLFQFCSGPFPDLSRTDGHVKTPIRILCNCCKCHNPLNFLQGATGSKQYPCQICSLPVGESIPIPSCTVKTIMSVRANNDGL